MDRGASRAAVYRITKSQTLLSDWTISKNNKFCIWPWNFFPSTQSQLFFGNSIYLGADIVVIIFMNLSPLPDCELSAQMLILYKLRITNIWVGPLCGVEWMSFHWQIWAEAKLHTPVCRYQIEGTFMPFPTPSAPLGFWQLSHDQIIVLFHHQSPRMLVPPGCDDSRGSLSNPF